jgi:UDP-N-acetylmuramoylalanine--D-glutamate ligase
MPLVIPDFLRPLLTKPVAIFGGGVSGEGVSALLDSLEAKGIVYDAKGVEFTPAVARTHALVVYSPGFRPDHPWLAAAAAAGAVCLGELDFASLFWRGEVIAITGTNGKTTLTEFLTHALRRVGRNAHATGNIGHSFSRLVTELDGGVGAVAVCEVSSFQAETLQHFRASATLWTNFAEDHLERHPSLAAYFAAKWNLTLHTMTTPTGGVFVGSSVRRYAVQFDRPLAAITCVDTEDRPADPALAGTVFEQYPQRENFLLAKAWWHAGGHPENQLNEAARTFKLGRHRLTRLAEIAGITYWNDSKATNFHAVEAALLQFRSPVVLIIGGKPKGGDIGGFIQRLATRVFHVLLIGATRAELAVHCRAHHVPHTVCASLAEAVRQGAKQAPAGGHVLLSPGFASFDQFRNYEDRGEQFEKLVRELAAATPDQTRASVSNLR